jgi:hypothetical protein
MALATRDRLPLILIRGFGGLDVEDEKRIAYQGFNDGTVYPGKRGENYITRALFCGSSSPHGATTTPRTLWDITETR